MGLSQGGIYLEKITLRLTVLATVLLFILSSGCFESEDGEESEENEDSDGDGFPNTEDAFPNNVNEWLDTDGDGVGDNGDAFPNDSSETQDTDGDGVGDNSDEFPNDPTETRDSDRDGTGDNADDYPDDFSNQARLEIVKSNMYRDGDYAYVVGILRNNKTKNVIGHIYVDINLYKQDGSYFKDDEVAVGVLIHLVLEPGDTFSFKGEFNDSDKLAASYSLEVKAGYTDEDPLDDVIVTEDDGSYDIIFGEYSVSGSVKNNGDYTAKNVEISVAYYDSSSKLIDVEAEYSSPMQLGNGETGEFTVTTNCPDSDQINSYKIWVGYFIE
jgi:hypothetical protein